MPAEEAEKEAEKLVAPSEVLAQWPSMGKRILLVDDEAGIRSLAAEALERVEYEVLTAADASEALCLAEGADLGLIILDLNLAGESGLALMKFLQRNHPGVRIILYTGMEHEYSEVADMMQKGAHRYVRKGTMEELVQAVRSSFQ
jgi:DNA-binding NtrC family response regulator